MFQAFRARYLATWWVPALAAFTALSPMLVNTLLFECEMTIYEGGWGIYYPARFELWFAPDSGKPERKLAERIFRVEGWER